MRADPGDVGTLFGVAADVGIPVLDEHGDLDFGALKIQRNAGTAGQRSGYPDLDIAGPAVSEIIGFPSVRAELKLVYLDPTDVKMKNPPTMREPSARLAVHKSLVKPDDLLLVAAYKPAPIVDEPDSFAAQIVDFKLFSARRCVQKRDSALTQRGGRWFGSTPTVLSRLGQRKVNLGQALDLSSYGKKDADGRDFNEDTNFGKLSRIPYALLLKFLQVQGLKTACLSN